MLPFNNEFNNDNPLHDLDQLASLNTVSAAILLVLGNLAGIATFLYARLIGSFFLAYSILASVIVSFFYHLCQTTHECFQFPLTRWISSDHFTATSMMGLVLLSIFNVRTVCQLINKRRHIRIVQERTATLGVPPCTQKRRRVCDIIDELAQQPLYEPFVPEPDLCECGQEMVRHLLYDSIEENLIYDEWTSACAIIVITVTTVAVYAHPYSYAAFNIVIATCITLAFWYIVFIKEGEPENFAGRISWPELIISIILSALGLAAYVLDSYVEYMWLHSVWHVAIYLGIMFFLAGTMKSVNGWVPLYAPCCNFFGNLCCYGYEEYSDGAKVNYV